MDFDAKGDAPAQAMSLIMQLEGKIRVKNERIEELTVTNEELHEIIDEMFRRLDIDLENNGGIKDIRLKIVGLQNQCHMWRTKFILSTMLNWANPFPLIFGFLMGGGLGVWVEWLIMRRR